MLVKQDGDALIVFLLVLTLLFLCLSLGMLLGGVRDLDGLFFSIFSSFVGRLVRNVKTAVFLIVLEFLEDALHFVLLFRRFHILFYRGEGYLELGGLNSRWMLFLGICAVLNHGAILGSILNLGTG